MKPMPKKFHEDQLKFGRILGEGMYGWVSIAYLSRGRVHRSGREQVAVKIPHEWESLNKEISIMGKLKNPNLVRMIGIMEDNTDDPWIIMEYFSRGDMSTFLQKNMTNGISLRRRIEMSLDIVAGMKYLHDNNIVHGDLHSQNCFVTIDGHIKVGDFGLSFIVTPDKELSDSIMYKGRPSEPARYLDGARFKSPEIIPGPFHQPKLSKPGDVWSFGTLMFELWTNSFMLPFGQFDRYQVLSLVAKGEQPIQYYELENSKLIWDLMKKCWAFEPINRANFLQIENFLFDNIESILDGN